MKYLFHTEALGGYMLQSNPHKRHLKTEVQGEGEDRVQVPLNEIRESDLAFDWATETLQIVSDEVVVVARPPRPIVVPKSVTRLGLRKAFRRSGVDVSAIRAEIELVANEDKREDGLLELEHGSAFARDSDLIQFIGNKLNISDAEMDAIFVLARSLE